MFPPPSNVAVCHRVVGTYSAALDSAARNSSRRLVEIPTSFVQRPLSTIALKHRPRAIAAKFIGLGSNEYRNRSSSDGVSSRRLNANRSERR